MNGIFPADVAVYLVFFPIVSYIFMTHRWSGFLPWYYLIVFCLARIVGGALGIHDSNSLAANIIQSVGVSPLLLSVDGLIHEARVYRYPSKSQILGWSVVIATTSIMAAAIALSIVGALNIYEGHPKPDSYSFWKAGTALIVVLWILQVFWSLFSMLPHKDRAQGLAGQGSTAIHPDFILIFSNDTSQLLQGAFIALLFIGIRVIYTLVAVCTRKKDLSPVTGSTAVRVVLLFLPEALATLTLIVVGLRTRHLRDLKLATRY
ncbi:integral membrane protein [Penicillium odoratum]|uniref:uncharacterized protein n=1 Tax=Penicillium odoratum TaxID=1167516 RepID=UPI0025476170|nr:uncharacterized protein N7520_002525 [Penicillium odoratum]KAJ5771996.1 integral membrane protein [Penicillium odoratum]